MLAHCAILREKTLRTAKDCFGHRLMMDCIVPGGVARDIANDGAAEIESLLRAIDDAFPTLLRIYDSTTSLQDRTVGTGKVSVDLVRQFAAGGFVGRGSGRDFDARVASPYAPYES
jgi:Ni,Fe-hydrogenase III large subunit